MIMSEMQVMDPTGHTQVHWSPSDVDEVKTAREVFDKMRKKGYRAFYAGRFGSKKGRMDEFDPGAEKLILIPQLVGG